MTGSGPSSAGAFDVGAISSPDGATLTTLRSLPISSSEGTNSNAPPCKAGISLAAAGAAEAWRELDQLFGRQPAVATIGEIMQAFLRINPEAAHTLVARMMEDALTSPVLGTFGDIANLGRNVTRGAAGETHFFNPVSRTSMT